MTYTLLLGNSIEKLKEVETNSVDSVVTDPPYELGFMNNSWDRTGIAYNVPFWKEVYRTLKPGGHLVAFSSPRTYHRMVCAVEDTGFEIRDQLQWIHANAFPKALDISKQIDKENGSKREKILVPTKRGNRKLNPKERSLTYSTDTFAGYTDISLPVSEDAKKWDGWKTGLKPCYEPICLARKPVLERTIVKNILKWGTGALNIDACRIEINGEIVPINKLEKWSGFGQEIRPDYVQEINTKGRYPSNIIFDEEAGKMLNKQSNNASRFFYCAKASKKEKNLGLDDEDSCSHQTVKPINLMRYLCKLVTPTNGIILDPFMGSGSTCIGAILENFSFIGIEMDQEYFDIAQKRIRYWEREKKGDIDLE